VLRIPDLVDDDEAGTVFEYLPEPIGRILDPGESRAIARKPGVGGAESGNQVGCLAEGDPDDAVVEVGDDIVVVAGAAASVVLPKPPAPESAVATATGFARSGASRRFFSASN
jgi:hypothetical protein